MNKSLRIVIYSNILLLILATTYFFALPAFILIQALNDPGLRGGEIPRFAFGWHRALSQQFGPWARERVASARAAQLGTDDISGTEWPVFSSVFYLWATESLQDAWEQDLSLAPTGPAQYAQESIAAAAALVADPNHASWVKQHWGSDYLRRENLFYRMLLISGLTSYQKLSGERTYETLLREQVESLANELDASPFGLLDDYPGQCYPIDILPAIAAIRRADKVLGTDHTAFVQRAVRGFEAARLDPETGLPAYVADSKTGQGSGSARGVGLAFMLIWAPELWPETAQTWLTRYQQYFWQQDTWLAGVREFPREYAPANRWLLVDVDAGPVFFGYGSAASAFGIGAARVNGHFEQAYPLSAEALVAAWPLADGTLLGPRLLSNLSDAPYVGEAALLFSLTRRPLTDIAQPAGSLPLVVYLALAVYLGVALAGVGIALRRAKRLRTQPSIAGWQFNLWLGLVAFGMIALLASWSMVGGLCLLVAQFLPRNG